MLLFLLAQITPVQPMPKGTGLPPPVSEESAVMVPIDRLFGALSAGDPAAVLAATRPEGGATVAIEQNGTRRVRHLTWTEFASALKPGADRLAERITDPAVEIDGDIAMVWAPYTFTRNGAVEHCGYDHFDLVREGGSWRILNVTWSQRTTGCVVP